MTHPRLSWLFVRQLRARVAAVDALRGLAVCGMILVNIKAPSGASYSQLDHAFWDGWTLADTIFPTFLFIVGVSIALSLSSKDGRRLNATQQVHGKILKRGGLLLLLNVLLVNFPYYDLETIKLTGTLARIGLCSIAGALVFLHLGWRAQATLLAFILAGHWALLEWLGPDAFLAFDHALLGTHYRADWENGFDSTSLSTTAAAVASTIAGTLTGQWLLQQKSSIEQSAGLLTAGFIVYALGGAFGLVHPINKMMWSSSFVVLMAGLSMMALGACYRLAESPIGRAAIRPFEIAGLNALAFYVGAHCLQVLLVYGRLQTSDGTTERLRQIVFDILFAPWVDGPLSSLLYSLTFLGICYAAVYALYRARIFIRL